MNQTLCQLIHGEPGVGKSWYAQTTPAPRLVLDAEGGSRAPWRNVNGKATRQKLVTWDPRHEPPEPNGWEVCYVAVQDFSTLGKAYAWLNSGRHPFKSVVIDSLTEIQKRCKDIIAGVDTLSDRQWGDLLLKMEHEVRFFRDLVFHPIHPLETVTFIALSDSRTGKYKPAVQGALSISLPGFVDLEGYLYNEQVVDPEDESKMTTERKLLIAPLTTQKGSYEAKDRTHLLTAKYGLTITNPDVEQMLEVLNEGDVYYAE